MKILAAQNNTNNNNIMQLKNLVKSLKNNNYKKPLLISSMN